MNNTRSNRALNTIGRTAGRFFGLETSNEVINARLINFGPSMITVEDRNAGCNRRFSKSQVKAVTFRGARYTSAR